MLEDRRGQSRKLLLIEFIMWTTTWMKLNSRISIFEKKNAQENINLLYINHKQGSDIFTSEKKWFFSFIKLKFFAFLIEFFSYFLSLCQFFVVVCFGCCSLFLIFFGVDSFFQSLYIKSYWIQDDTFTPLLRIGISLLFFLFTSKLFTRALLS